MNKIFSISLLFGVLAAFSSCGNNEEDAIFDQTAAERLNAASSLYSQRLGASANGWALQLYPTNDNKYPQGAGYLLLVDFDPDYSVKVAMNNEFSNDVYAEDRSAWQIITDDGPVLSFNTYNKCLHAFTNPEDIPFTGSLDDKQDETGTGVGGDYEFIIVDAPEDGSYLMLKGKKRGTYNLLTPLEDGVDYKSYLADVKTFQDNMFSTSSPSFDVLHFGDSIYKMEDASKGVPSIYPYNGDKVIDQTYNPFLVTKRSKDYYLRFRSAFSVTTDKKVQDFKYNTEKDVFESVENNVVDGTYYIDGDSPLRFFNEIIDGTTHRWQWDKSSDMSETFSQLYSKIADGFKSSTLSNMCFRNDGKNVFLRVSYKSGKSNADFNFTLTKEDDGVTFKYVGASDSKYEALLTAIPELKELIDKLSQKFTVTAGTTKFNLRTIKLTATSDTNFWFVATDI
jgi:hypothetical protein